MGLLNLLGFGSKTNQIKEFKERGAIIIDVRTSGEFQQGHIKGSKNIPLDSVFSKVASIKNMNKPVIVCCRSGMRSAQAASILKNNGVEVINGGSWDGLESQL